MLEEAVEVIRDLWRGKVTSHRGRHYRVQNAKLYTLPRSCRSIHVAAGGERMAEVAGRIGDGLISTGPDKKLLGAYRRAGGDGPRFGQMTVCWAASERAARKTAHEWWPTAALHGEVTQELPNPSQFTDLAQSVTEDQVAEAIMCGPDAERPSREDPGVHRRRLRPRVPPPGRAGPGRVPRLRPQGAAPAPRARGRRSRSDPHARRRATAGSIESGWRGPQRCAGSSMSAASGASAPSLSHGFGSSGLSAVPSGSVRRVGAARRSRAVSRSCSLSSVSSPWVRLSARRSSESPCRCSAGRCSVRSMGSGPGHPAPQQDPGQRRASPAAMTPSATTSQAGSSSRAASGPAAAGCRASRAARRRSPGPAR